MSVLQDALDRWDGWGGWGGGAYQPTFSDDEAEALVDAARRVANPDYEAAIAVMWNRDAYSESKEENMQRAVDAAFGVRENTE